MKKALFPGTFDPPTFGHFDIIKRGIKLFDQFIIGIAHNASKKTLLPIDVRLNLLQEWCSDKHCKVIVIEGLVSEFVREQDITCVIRGCRNTLDFEREWSYAWMNEKLSGVETLFLPSSASTRGISSTLVREVAAHQGDLTPFVSESVTKAVKQYQ